MKKIRESKFQEKTRAHISRQLPDNLLRFSFKYMHVCEKFPLKQCHTYMRSLFDRLKDVSHMPVKDFMINNSKGLRSHSHDWSTTTEPNGYSNLNEHLRQCMPWQFSLSSNENGRVHGLLIDDIFYVVWLDPDHKLYS